MVDCDSEKDGPNEHENTLQRALEFALSEILEGETSHMSTDEIIAKAMDLIPDLVETTAESMLTTIKSEAESGLEAERDSLRKFEERLFQRWQKPLNLLDLFISLCVEAGYEFNKSHREHAVRTNDALFEALTRLHARACQIASAILVLLRSGFADDAHARWRALHEISVVSQFLGDAGEDTAERYLLHDVVQRYKLAIQYQKHAKALNEDPLPTEEFEILKTRRDDLVKRYGKPFKEEYGWAASVLGKKRPTIVDIEDSVNLEHWRPYYRMASDNVHANVHSTYSKLGVMPQKGDVLLAGPSNAGLADPGHSAAISLHQVTLALLATKASFDAIVVMRILEDLVDEIGVAFLKAHRELEPE